MASRPATSQRTYGHYRLEVLAALANGLLLFGVAGYVIYEAFQRFTSPPAVPGLPLLIVASIGLVVNLISFRLHDVLDSVTGLLATDYHLTHATIQCEPADHQDNVSPI